MRWPFVRWQMYLDECEALRQELAHRRDEILRLDAALKDERHAYRELVKELLALKRENFATPAAAPTMPSEPALPEPVELALREMEAGLPKDVQRAQRQKAIALLGTDKTPAQVAEIVRRGQNALRVERSA